MVSFGTVAWDGIVWQLVVAATKFWWEACQVLDMVCCYHPALLPSHAARLVQFGEEMVARGWLVPTRIKIGSHTHTARSSHNPDASPRIWNWQKSFHSEHTATPTAMATPTLHLGKPNHTFGAKKYRVNTLVLKQKPSLIVLSLFVINDHHLLLTSICMIIFLIRGMSVIAW